MAKNYHSFGKVFTNFQEMKKWETSISKDTLSMEKMAADLDRIFKKKSPKKDSPWETDKAKIENNFLREEQYKLKKEVSNLKGQNTKLKNKNGELKKQIEEFEKKIKELNHFGREDILDLEE